ncbi:telomere length regulation protein TEL2 homolog isoform X1 [Achroia grisella]|uniref:telomere length regulation protein TEL2 homolog isoform X1 n=1 Tax=Achroia grisella TaxID=688607 RepID=UPI0027D29E46|nr:telomere length regulation protein TEL2 homolog isoform X1 [Achroia grisella]
MDRFISMWKVRELADKVTNVVMNYTEVEGKVREATSDEAWGPTGQQMQELALATFTYEHFPEVMSMLWRRMLHDNRAHWRRTYKCLLLLSYLVRNGSERVVTSAREHIYDLRSLENYSYVDDLGKDQGINVRHKVRELIDFIQDDEKLREERKKAKKNKDKYIGMSSDAAVMGMRSGSGGWGEYSDRSSNWDEPKDRRVDEEEEYDRDDSDGDYSHRKPHKENVYRDAESVGGGVVAVGGRQSPELPTGKSLNISLKSPPARKPSTPVKKIDLGAAATYGKSSGPTPAPTPTTVQPRSHTAQQSQELLDDLFKTCSAPTTGNLMLEDDFDPRAEEQKPATKENAEFGEFANAFGAPPASGDDGFADFTSAFTAASPPAPNATSLAAPAPAPPPAAVNSPASNLDLLSDLSGPMPSFGIESLGGQLAATTLQPLQPSLQPAHQGEAKTKLTSPQEHLQQAIKNFLDSLQSIEKIKSENDVNIIRTCFENLKNYLPGPITVQKLSGIDEILFTNEVLESYSLLLSCVIRILLPHWPLFKDELINLFTPEESFRLSLEILLTLCGFLKNESTFVCKAITFLLLRYVKGDIVLTGVVDSCVVELPNEKDIYKHQLEWENYVQLLVTLPERVANKLETETPKEFSHENYSYNLVFHIIRCIDFLAESSYAQRAQYNISYLSQLLSKIIINYNMNGNSEAIIKFIDVLITWTDDKEMSKFVKRKLIQTIFHQLNRQAIDCLSVILLKKCPIDYRSQEQCILNLLGDNINTNKDWADILTNKVPFYIKYMDYNDTTVAENLIYYISTAKNCVDTLSELILRLAYVWSDVQLNNVGNIPEHVYISQLLILAVKYRVVMSSLRNITWSISRLKTVLFKGMSKHLDVLSQEFRCIGMATIEIIFKILADLDTSDKEAANSLNFDYDDMGDVCKGIYNILKRISNRCLIDVKHETAQRLREINVKNIFDTIINKVVDEEYRPVQNTIVTCAVKSPEQTKEIVKTIISVKLDALEKKRTSDVEDLDSDDDLQPYDMSNDIPVSAKKQPNYLRDLLEMLVEAKDVETFEASLIVSEDLVARQLKTEDSKLAIELLNLFVHLDDKYNVDNFETIKFNTTVAIVCSQPKVCAEQLCKEIHTDVGRYSIATKMFMLDVLSEAANRIADVRPHVDEKPKAKVVTKIEDDMLAEEIIRKRLINKTRYFHSKRPHPFAKAKRNEFAAVSDSFFYPLVGGFGVKQLTLSHHNLKQDVDNILLLKYLSVVGNIVLASKNCPKCPIYCWEILQMMTYMRYTPDPRLQSCVISIVASVIFALPPSILKSEFFDVLIDFRHWFAECLNNVDLTMRLGGPKSETAIFAGQVLWLLEKSLMDTDE